MFIHEKYTCQNNGEEKPEFHVIQKSIIYYFLSLIDTGNYFELWQAQKRTKKLCQLGYLFPLSQQHIIQLRHDCATFCFILGAR
jgi:hypothetical protein